MSIIQVHNLTKKFGDITAVDDLNLEVKEGEVLGFLGPNGAGKTTTIRMLAGIIAPTSGYAEIAGQRTDGNIEHLHEVIGLLTETPALYDRLSAERNLKYFAGFYPIALVATVATVVGLIVLHRIESRFFSGDAPRERDS